MDRAGSFGNRDRRSAATLTLDPLRGTCLTRSVDLDVCISLRDWPGISGPVVHLPDPFVSSSFVDDLAGRIAPQFRVLSISPRPHAPYQLTASDLVQVLDQFGFETPILVGEGLGCLPSLLVAAWHPERVHGLVLVSKRCEAPQDSIEARALRDCPPDWDALFARVTCPRVEATSVERVEAFVLASLP